MAVSLEFREYLKDMLAVLGPIRMRAMFGGLGIYCGDLFFALVIEDQLYFKADVQTVSLFEEQGSRPFEYERQGKTASLRYFTAPESVYEDEDEMRYWGRLALAAAQRSGGKTRKPARDV